MLSAALRLLRRAAAWMFQARGEPCPRCGKPGAEKDCSWCDEMGN